MWINLWASYSWGYLINQLTIIRHSSLFFFLFFFAIPYTINHLISHTPHLWLLCFLITLLIVTTILTFYSWNFSLLIFMIVHTTYHKAYLLTLVFSCTITNFEWMVFTHVPSIAGSSFPSNERKKKNIIHFIIIHFNLHMTDINHMQVSSHPFHGYIYHFHDH